MGSRFNGLAARYAILGDIHANLVALRAVLRDAQEQRCHQYACVGDIVGYHASPRECLQIVRDLSMPCVQGNHDEYCASDEPLGNINPRAKAATLWTREQLSEADKRWLRELKYVRVLVHFTIVHATLDTPERWGYVFGKLDAATSFTYQTTPVCFFGHTHMPVAYKRNGFVSTETYSKFKLEAGSKYFVNVGSVGEPRDQDARAAYVIYDLGEGTIELRRVSYDLEQAAALDLAAGLPSRQRKA
jgi:predicted phosphodiesterase